MGFVCKYFSPFLKDIKIVLAYSFVFFLLPKSCLKTKSHFVCGCTHTHLRHAYTQLEPLLNIQILQKLQVCLSNTNYDTLKWMKGGLLDHKMLFIPTTTWLKALVQHSCLISVFVVLVLMLAFFFLVSLCVSSNQQSFLIIKKYDRVH